MCRVIYREIICVNNIPRRDVLLFIFRTNQKFQNFSSPKKLAHEKNENFQILIFFEIYDIKYEDLDALNASVLIICSQENFLRSYGNIHSIAKKYAQNNAFPLYFFISFWHIKIYIYVFAILKI